MSMPSARKDETQRQEIRELIRQMEDLPTLPSVAVKVMNTLLDEASSAQDVADIVEVDPALTMKVLMVANSAFYGIAREVSTVKRAIVGLGFSKMRSIILSLSVLDTVEAMVEESELDSSEFWTHSLKCAVGAQAIASKLGEEFSDEIFVAGLLHDIGKLVLSRQMPAAFKQAVEMAGKEGIRTVDAEEVMMHMDHAQVGACIMEQWEFPIPLRESVWQHHDPPLRHIDSDVSVRMGAIIYLVDILSDPGNMGLRTSEELARREEIREHFRLPETDLAEIAERLDEQVSEIARALRLETVPQETYFEILQRTNAELARMSLLLRESEERYRGLFEIVRQTLMTLSHHMRNATEAVAARTETCDRDAPPACRGRVDASLLQTKRISIALGALDQLIPAMDVQDGSDVGLPDAIRDIEEKLKRTLGES